MAPGDAHPYLALFGWFTLFDEIIKIQYNIKTAQTVQRSPTERRESMQALVYVALCVLVLAFVIFAARSYRHMYQHKVGQSLVDIGFAVLTLFVGLVLAGNASTTGAALMMGSPIIMTVPWVLAIIGVGFLVSAGSFESWRRSMQAWRYRRDERKVRKLDRREAERAHGQEFLSEVSQDAGER